MKSFKNSIFYIVVTGGFSALIYWILAQGSYLKTAPKSLPVRPNPWTEFLDSMVHNLKHPLAILLAQIITIIIVARFLGGCSAKSVNRRSLAKYCRNRAGPSLVGMYFPEFSQALFPTESLGNLQFLSQIGLILFMFVIGMELDLKVLQNKAKEAVVISHASIVIPFALGVGWPISFTTDSPPNL
jgi:hypothetical protein